MEELFRLKIASKRQVTLPQRLLNLLELAEGDEIRLEVQDGQITSAEACRVVPTRLFTPEILKQIATREAKTAPGKLIDPEHLLETAQVAEYRATGIRVGRAVSTGDQFQSYPETHQVARLKDTAGEEGSEVNTRATKRNPENAR